MQNISLDQIFISNAKGYGLYAKDIFDSAHVVDSAFLNSTKHPNLSQSGNVRFNFEFSSQSYFTSLLLDSSWFMYGMTSYDHSSVAGGLTIAISGPNVNVRIVNVTAKGNTGSIGGNIALFLMLYKANSSSVVINNSRILNGYAMKGAGLAFWSLQSREYDNSDNEKYFCDRNILTICNTNFNNNFAIDSGGAMYMAHYNHATMIISDLKQVTITNCTFTENGGKGSSVDIIQHSLQPMTPFLNTSLCYATSQTTNWLMVMELLSRYAQTKYH